MGANTQLEKDNSEATDIDITCTQKESVISNFSSSTVV